MGYSTLKGGRDPLKFMMEANTWRVSRTQLFMRQGGGKSRGETGPGMDLERHMEDAQHHPTDYPLTHPNQRSIPKPMLQPQLNPSRAYPW